MINYIPRGKVRQILMTLDEDGAQFSQQLALRTGISVDNLRNNAHRLLERGLIDKIPRHYLYRPSSLWYLTPAGMRVVDRIRAQEASKTTSSQQSRAA